MKKQPISYKATEKIAKEDWEFLKGVLPEGWEKAAQTTGAFLRERGRHTHGIRTPETLLRILWMHLLEGISLRETAVRATVSHLAKISDVGILKRLRHSGSWFQWMTLALQKRFGLVNTDILANRRLKLVDGSIVCEPGATGSTWRIHYSMDLATLCCQEVLVSPPSQGESLKHFTVNPGDIFVADRGFGRRSGIRHVVDQKGDVVIRLSSINVPLHECEDAKTPFLWDLRLQALRMGEVGDWPAVMHDETGMVPVRVCAIRKSEEETRVAQAKLRKSAAKKQRKLRAKTLERAGYIIIVTTLPKQVASAQAVMEIYRCRWQIELSFKRLKSLLQLGHLRKKDPEGSKAWLQGKILVAIFIETLLCLGERFSPWGYFVSTPSSRAGKDATS